MTSQNRCGWLGNLARVTVHRGDYQQLFCPPDRNPFPTARRVAGGTAPQGRHRRVVPGHAAHPAAAHRARPAQQHVRVPGRHAPALRRVALHVRVVGGERERQVPVEDVPTGQPQLTLQVQRRPRLHTRPPVRVDGQAVRDRLRQTRVQRRERRLQQRRARRLVVPREQPGGGVQPEQRQRLVAPRGQVGGEDRGVGQRVAVHLARRGARRLPGRRLPVGVLQLPVTLGDMEGPGERLPRIGVRVPQRGQPPQQHVHLELRPLRRLRRRVPEQLRQRLRRNVHQHLTGPDRALRAVRAERHLGPPPVRGHGRHLVPGGDLGPGSARRRGQRAGHRAHAADRHVPVTGTLPDHVVEKAAVLTERRVVRGGERADEPVGENHPAHQIVVERGLHRLAQRPFEQRLPCLVVADPGAQRGLRRQRFGQRGEDPSRHPPRRPVESEPRLVLPVGPGEPGERFPRPALPAADEQPGRPPPALGGRVGRELAPAQRQPQVQILHDPLRQQADEVRVPGDPGRHPGERHAGHGRAAGPVQAFQHQRAASGAGEVGGGDQTVVAATDDHGVVRGEGGHSPFVTRRARTGQWAAPRAARPVPAGAGDRHVSWSVVVLTSTFTFPSLLSFRRSS